MGRRAGAGYAGPRLWLSPDTRNDSFHFLSFVPISTTMASFDAVSAWLRICAACCDTVNISVCYWPRFWEKSGVSFRYSDGSTAGHRPVSKGNS
jgi:hypothetical protein